MEENHIAEAEIPSIWELEIFNQFSAETPPTLCALNILVHYEAHSVATKAGSVGWSKIATEAYVFS